MFLLEFLEERRGVLSDVLVEVIEDPGNVSQGGSHQRIKLPPSRVANSSVADGLSLTKFPFILKLIFN